MKWLYALPVAAALIMSFISSRLLFVGSGLSLIPWGILAVLFGVIAKTKKEALRLGAIYGFCQAFIFLWIDKRGNLKISQFFVLFFIISSLAIFAGGCAAVAGRLGFLLKEKAH